MERLKSLILRDRHSLLGATVAVYIILVVIEGLVTDRETRVFSFDNPFLEIKLNNIEEYSSDRTRSR